jgi:putative ABC transport system ATP-binding protein
MTMGRDISAMVKAENLSKTYHLSNQNRVEALRNATISLSRGQSVILRGPSGSGKSTLLNLLSFLDHPTAGHIYHEGEDVTGFSEEELCRIRRERIGFVFQDFRLLPRMAAWENASISLVPLGIREKERLRRASAILDQLGLHERIFHRPEEMSGGEQQRLAMARALINNPELLFADEPTSNIDADSARKALEILAGLRSKGCTIVLATHDAALIHQFEADAVYRLVNGIIEPG